LLRTNASLPNRLDQLSWAASARAGTLVTRDLLATRQGAVELPLVVATGNAPADLRPGDRIDVWASVAPKTDEATNQSAGTAQRILSRVRVLSRSSGTSVGGASGTTVVVDVAGLSVGGRVVGAVSSGRITIVRVS
jgi:Flp pilus assembly protein CpaB